MKQWNIETVTVPQERTVRETHDHSCPMGAILAWLCVCSRVGRARWLGSPGIAIHRFPASHWSDHIESTNASLRPCRLIRIVPYDTAWLSARRMKDDFRLAINKFAVLHGNRKGYRFHVFSRRSNKGILLAATEPNSRRHDQGAT